MFHSTYGFLFWSHLLKGQSPTNGNVFIYLSVVVGGVDEVLAFEWVKHVPGPSNWTCLWTSKNWEEKKIEKKRKGKNIKFSILLLWRLTAPTFKFDQYYFKCVFQRNPHAMQNFFALHVDFYTLLHNVLFWISQLFVWLLKKKSRHEFTELIIFHSIFISMCRKSQMKEQFFWDPVHLICC